MGEILKKMENERIKYPDKIFMPRKNGESEEGQT